jgi:hypothetical protein
MEMANDPVFYDDRLSLSIELVDICDSEVAIKFLKSSVINKAPRIEIDAFNCCIIDSSKLLFRICRN